MATIDDSARKNRDQNCNSIKVLHPSQYLFILGSLIAAIAVLIPYSIREWSALSGVVAFIDIVVDIIIYIILIILGSWLF